MSIILPSFAGIVGPISSGGGGGGGSFTNTYSLDLDGSDDYIDIGGSYDLGTFSAWFKPDNVLSASQSPYMIAGFTAVGISPYGFRAGILVSGNVPGRLSNEIKLSSREIGTMLTQTEVPLYLILIGIMLLSVGRAATTRFI